MESDFLADSNSKRQLPLSQKPLIVNWNSTWATCTTTFLQLQKNVKHLFFWCWNLYRQNALILNLFNRKYIFFWLNLMFWSCNIAFWGWNLYSGIDSSTPECFGVLGFMTTLGVIATLDAMPASLEPLITDHQQPYYPTHKKYSSALIFAIFASWGS